MSMSTASSTQALLNHFVQQVWAHDWGYIVFAAVMFSIDVVATEWFRNSHRRNYWRR